MDLAAEQISGSCAFSLVQFKDATEVKTLVLKHMQYLSVLIHG